MTWVTYGGNSPGPSFSRGGQYIIYTAHTNVQGRDELRCEIFLMDLYSGESRQLTYKTLAITSRGGRNKCFRNATLT